MNQIKLNRYLNDVIEEVAAAERFYQDREKFTVNAVHRGLISVDESVERIKASRYQRVQEQNEAIGRAAWFITALADGRPVSGIKIDGYDGTWHVIDVKPRELYGRIQPLLLMEHDRYGDEAACLLVTESYKVVLDDVWNGYSDFDEL